jgi:hypothetical protein
MKAPDVDNGIERLGETSEHAHICLLEAGAASPFRSLFLRTLNSVHREIDTENIESPICKIERRPPRPTTCIQDPAFDFSFLFTMRDPLIGGIDVEGCRCSLIFLFPMCL